VCCQTDSRLEPAPKSFFVGNIIHIFSEKDTNFDVYTIVIDEKLEFFVAKIWMVLVEKDVLERLLGLDNYKN
jgi:hypothetical protein